MNSFSLWIHRDIQNNCGRISAQGQKNSGKEGDVGDGGGKDDDGDHGEDEDDDGDEDDGEDDDGDADDGEDEDDVEDQSLVALGAEQTRAVCADSLYPHPSSFQSWGGAPQGHSLLAGRGCGESRAGRCFPAPVSGNAALSFDVS